MSSIMKVPSGSSYGGKGEKCADFYIVNRRSGILGLNYRGFDIQGRTINALVLLATRKFEMMD
jgi:hypothetical protein